MKQFIRLPKELEHPRNGLINIQNIDDNKWFKWSFLIKYVNPEDQHQARITKAYKDFAKKYKGIKFSVKTRDIHKIDKKNSISISVFGYEKREKHRIYVSKDCCKEKLADLLLTKEKGKIHYFIIKDSNRFMYNHTLYDGKNIFVVIVYKLSVYNKY